MLWHPNWVDFNMQGLISKYVVRRQSMLNLATDVKKVKILLFIFQFNKLHEYLWSILIYQINLPELSQGETVELFQNRFG